MGIVYPSDDRLYVLEEYCIENYLFEEDAICTVFQEEKPSKSLAQWKIDLAVKPWLEKTVNQLTPLFSCYILIRKHKLEKADVGTGIGEFIADGKIPSLNEEKINQYILETAKQFKESNKCDLDEEMPKTIAQMGVAWTERKRNICGKKYLLPLLIFEIKRHCRRTLTSESLRFRLVEHCYLDSLIDLKKKVDKIYNIP